MNGREVQVEFRLTTADLLRTTGWALSGGGQRNPVFFLGFFGLVIVAGLYTFIDSVMRGHPLWGFLALPAVPLLCAAFVLFTARQQANRDARQERGRRYTIDDSGIAVDSSMATGRMDWSHVWNVAETPKLFLILSPLRIVTHALPKRAFAPGQEELFREIVAAHVDSTSAEAVTRKGNRLLKRFLLWCVIFVVVILLYNTFAK